MPRSTQAKTLRYTLSRILKFDKDAKADQPLPEERHMTRDAADTSGVELIETRVGRLGVRKTGAGLPVILWHSMFVDSRTWDRVIPDLSRDHTVITIDGPSFGASDPLTRSSSILECADAAVDVMDHLGIASADWVGNAWGGHVGIALAAKYPARVTSLCAIGAPTHRLSGHERLQVVVLRPVVRVFGFLPFVTTLISSALLNDQTRANDPEALEIVASGFRDVDRRGFDFAIGSFVIGRPDLTVEARTLRIPTLFAAGDDRGEWTLAQAAAVTSTMPNGQAAALAGVRGIAPLEAPSAVVELIRSFWGSTADD